MKDAIKNFAKQFEFEPRIENGKLGKFDKFVIAGMGGSHLAADLIKAWKPSAQITIWSDYGLPEISKKDLANTLFIASSYSGNTEETLDAFQAAGKLGVRRAAICVGGELLRRAKSEKVPYVLLPDTGIQPRMSLGFGFKALLALMGESAGLNEASELSKTLSPEKFENRGRDLAKKLRGFVPIIYSSARNAAVAYNWKIKFNETGKIPAFYNILPELNHNEMTGFDVQPPTKNLSGRFHFIILADSNDYARVQKRMKILEKLYGERGLPITTIAFEGDGIMYRMISSLMLADWTAYYIAKNYGVEAEQVPMVEEFKKLMK